jgi:glycosyltransferase 2 family protein
MSKKTWNAVQLGLMFVLAGLFCWLAFRGQDWKSVWSRIAASHWEWVALGLCLTVLGHVSRARRWQLLLGGAGEKTSLLVSFSTMMSGYLVNMGVPRLGEVTRCVGVLRLGKGNLLAVGGTVLAERAIDLLCFGLLLVATLWTANARVSAFFESAVSAPLRDMLAERPILGIVGLSVLGLGCLCLLLWLAYGRRLGGGSRWLDRLQQWARAFWAGLLSAFKQRQPIAFLAHTAVIWVCYYSAPLCSLLALGLGEGQLWSLAFVVFVFGSLSRTLPLPGGSMGAYHALITQLMVAYAFSESDGLALATLNHGVQTVFYLLAGIFGMVVFAVLLRRKTRLEAQA